MSELDNVRLSVHKAERPGYLRFRTADGTLFEIDHANARILVEAIQENLPVEPPEGGANKALPGATDAQRLWRAQAKLLEALEVRGLIGDATVKSVLQAAELPVVEVATVPRATYQHRVKSGVPVLMRPGSLVVSASTGYGCVHVWVDAPAGGECVESRVFAVVPAGEPVAGRHAYTWHERTGTYSLYELEAQ